MGNRPKPTQLKVLMGNPGKRPLNSVEPEAQKGLPDAPDWLKAFPAAVREWEREGEILVSMGVMTFAEEGTFAMRCYLADQIQQLATEINKEGRVSYTSRMDSLGNEIMDAKANPKAIQLKNLITEYRQIGSLLGLDPSSRTRLGAGTEKPKSKFEGLIGVKK